MRKEMIIKEIERIDAMLDHLSIVTSFSKVIILNEMRNDLIKELDSEKE